MPFSAALDANVLHPIGLADLLLSLAARGLYRPVWSDEILAECRRSILRVHRDLDPADLQRRLDIMNIAFPDASVVGWRTLEPILRSEFGDDAHVVAAAMMGRADVIVTENVRDFPPAPTLENARITVQRVDEFLLNQWWLSPPTVFSVIVEQAAKRKKPPRTPGDIVNVIGKHAPEFADVVRVVLGAEST